MKETVADLNPASRLRNGNTGDDEITPVLNVPDDLYKYDTQNLIDGSTTSVDSHALTDNGGKQVRRSSVMSLLPGREMPGRTPTALESHTNVAFIQKDGGPSRCSLCSASFPKSHQLLLHMNIHYLNPERKFSCDLCGKNFQTERRLQNHNRSETHSSKVNFSETQGNSTSKDPRPFKCSYCNVAFRNNGHLVKHLRSKKHVQKLAENRETSTERSEI